MIKNIILDVGGVLFDDSKAHLSKILNRDASDLYHKIYGGGFKKCLLGEMTIDELKESFKNDSEYTIISYLLTDLKVSYPALENNIEYVKTLKKQGYKLYLLTNITKESHEYIDSVMHIDEIFDGGIYSYLEGLKKPDANIYELIIKRYNLNKNETLFFDDKEKNIIGAKNVGINGFVFKSIEDIKNNLEV